MSPTSWKHGRYVNELARQLGNFAREHQVGETLTGEVGIYTHRNPDTVRGADVAFISTERLGQVTSESYLDVAPELVIEVVSPGNTWQEMRDKIVEYFAIGVERVWIVEPEHKRVLVYQTPDESTTMNATDTLAGEGVLEGFSLSLTELFGD